MKNENEKIVFWKEPPEVLETKFGKAIINTNGYYRIISRKEGNVNKYLHRLVFEDLFGPVPEGFHVHHKNENKLDNRICNLELVRASDHSRKHMEGKKHSAETRKKMSESHKKRRQREKEEREKKQRKIEEF